ncbi:hypothetical protein RclHR1_09040004 [Rhizophagus clarus]|uniref:Uncharacterized protein n=1 Tax=Rhizophagus clarus TaxID=94130 RepID=A0A2Z6SDK4_9GLOM|nr:hypothetical protein RclHR1_09040004 [Rhizophagus clarus]
MMSFNFDSVKPFDLDGCIDSIHSARDGTLNDIEEIQLLEFYDTYLVKFGTASSRKSVTPEIVSKCLKQHKEPKLELFIEISRLTERLRYSEADYLKKDDAVEELELLLNEFKKFVKQLINKHDKIKVPLWECISYRLFKKGYDYSPIQVATRYKNFKTKDTGSNKVDTPSDSFDETGRRNEYEFINKYSQNQDILSYGNLNQECPNQNWEYIFINQNPWIESNNENLNEEGPNQDWEQDHSYENLNQEWSNQYTFIYENPNQWNGSNNENPNQEYPM